MVKIRVTSQGVIQEQGSGFEGAPTAYPSRTLTSNTTLVAGDAGAIILSASTGVITGTMPAAANSAGAMLVFRSTSPSAHVLTASSGEGNVFATPAISQADLIRSGARGSKVVFPATAGSSLAVMSDGAKWLVLGGSGSFAFTSEAV